MCPLHSWHFLVSVEDVLQTPQDRLLHLLWGLSSDSYLSNLLLSLVRLGTSELPQHFQVLASKPEYVSLSLCGGRRELTPQAVL